MADTEKNKIWIHLLMEKELAGELDRMVADDDSDRSKFIRNLVRQEVDRRQPTRSTSQPQKRSAGRRELAGSYSTR